AGRRDCCPPAPRRNLDESYDELQRLRKEVEVAEKRRRDSPERNHSLLVTPCHTGGDPMTMSERETGSLIGSDKVEGTTVYGADDSKIGTNERVMIDKVSGQVNSESSSGSATIITRG